MYSIFENKADLTVLITTSLSEVSFVKKNSKRLFIEKAKDKQTLCSDSPWCPELWEYSSCTWDMCDDPAATGPHSSYEINVCKGMKKRKVIRIKLGLQKVRTQASGERFAASVLPRWLFAATCHDGDDEELDWRFPSRVEKWFNAAATSYKSVLLTALSFCLSSWWHERQQLFQGAAGACPKSW